MLSRATWVMNLFPAELQPKGPEDFVMTSFHCVNPGALGNLGISLREGREFGRADTATAPRVVIISESAAKALWPSGNPIGKQLRRMDPSIPPMTVVGVVASGSTEAGAGVDDDYFFDRGQSYSQSDDTRCRNLVYIDRYGRRVTRQYCR